MAIYETVVTDGDGKAVAGAKGYVYVEGVLAALTDDAGLSIANPITTDALGHAKATVPSSDYVVRWSWLGRERYIYESREKGDPNRDKRIRSLRLLQESIARANYQHPALASTVPTIGAALASSGIATGTTWQVATGGTALHASKYTFVGANWGCPAGAFPNTELYRPEVAHQGNGTDPSTNPLYSGRVRFVTESPAFEIYVQCADPGLGGGFRMKVDGQYVKTGVIGNDGNGLFRYIPVTWGAGAAADRKLRHYELDFGSVGAFLGIRTTNIYKPAPWPQADGLRVLEHGDSFVATIVDSGSLDTALTGSMGHVIGDMIGQADFWGSGTGGAGWFNPAAHGQSWFNDRVALDVVANAPDVIIEHGGGNDESLLTAGTVTQAAYQARVEEWLQAVIAAKPETVIFMTGPLIATTAASGHTKARDAKQAAAAKYPQNVAFIDNLADPWTFGSGKQTATTGDGNHDWVRGSDAAHPTTEGHVYYSGRIVRAIAGAIPSLILANQP